MGFMRQKPVYRNEWAAQAFDKYPFFSFIEIGEALEIREWERAHAFKWIWLEREKEVIS